MLGYAIKAYKAIEETELEKEDAGGKKEKKKKTYPMTTDKPNVIITSLILSSNEEIHDANNFCKAHFYLYAEIKV